MHPGHTWIIAGNLQSFYLQSSPRDIQETWFFLFSLNKSGQLHVKINLLLLLLFMSTEIRECWVQPKIFLHWTEQNVVPLFQIQMLFMLAHLLHVEEQLQEWRIMRVGLHALPYKRVTVYVCL